MIAKSILKGDEEGGKVYTDEILVVDDEENVLLTISTILTQDGYKVDTASNGLEAIERLNRKSYDLVLTDMRMGKVNGLDVLEHVHKFSPSTVLIVLTGYASVEDTIEALRRNAYDYLIKPCLIEDLKQTVKRGLEHRRLELLAKQREQQLEAMNRELESLVKERTRDLENANRELQEKNKQMETFVYLVSHDLRSPLLSIQGLAAILQEEYKEQFVQGEGTRYVDMILKSAKQMNGLIDDLLEFSKLGRSSLKIQILDTNVLVREVWARVSHLDQSVEIVIKENLPFIRADYLKISQIFSNLLENSIKYRRNDVASKVEVDCQEDSQEWHFTISDNGSGFEPEYNERIFQLFHRLAEHGSGSGMGLPIVRKIAQMHGGHAWAEGYPGRGTKFHFTIKKDSSPHAKTF